MYSQNNNLRVARLKKRSGAWQSQQRRRRLRIECLEERKLLAGPNEAPVNLVPSEVSTFINAPLSFTEYRDNPIATSDSDGDLSDIQVTLTASHGTLSLAGIGPSANVVFVEGDGDVDPTLTLRGTPTAVNTAFHWVIFHPEQDYVGGAASIMVTSDDLGDAGESALVDTDVIAIEVRAIPEFDQPPTWPTIPGDLDTTFGTGGISILEASSGIDFLQELEVLADGKMLAVGSVNDHIGVYRFLPDMTPDLSFGLGGFIEHDVGDGVHASSMTIDSQGRILVGSQDLVLRLNPDGSLDNSFGTDGKVDDPFNSAQAFHARLIRDIKIRADGSIVVVGGFTSEGEHDLFQVACLLENGTLQWRQEYDVLTNDPNTDDFYHSRDLAYELVLRDDGTMLVIGKGGDNFEFSEIRSLIMLELDEAGNPLSELSIPTVLQVPNDVLVLPDRKLIIVGTSVAESFVVDSLLLDDFLVSRHHPDGSLDTTFGEDGVARIPILEGEDWSYNASLQDDGKILVAGKSLTPDHGWELSAVRLTSDGMLDPTFDGDGKLSLTISDQDDVGFIVQSLSDGKILLAGRSGNNVVMARLAGDSFQNAGENQPPINVAPLTASTRVNTPVAFTDHQGHPIRVTDADAGFGNVEVTLTAVHGTISLVYPDPTGNLNYSVGDGINDSEVTFTGRLNEVNAALQWVSFTPTDDYIGTEASLTVSTDDLGNSGTGGSKFDQDVIQITVNAPFAFEDSPTWVVTPGVLDEQFDDDGIRTLDLSGGVDFIRKMRLTENGNIIAVGGINDHFGIMRFNPDLTLDTSFGTNGFTETDIGEGRHAWEVIEHPDGGWIVSGAEAVVRYTESGELDPSFGTDGIAANPHFDRGNSVAVSADGVILVAGNAAGQFHLSRYTLDGELISDRGQFEGQRTVAAFPRANGDILLAGGDDGFQSMRINVRGTLQDHTELGGVGAIANDSLLLPDGSFLVVGQRNGHILLGRFNPDGTSDLGFGTEGTTEVPMLMASDSALGVSLQPDGKILVVGHTGVGDLDPAIVRLSYDGVLDPTFDLDGTLRIPVSNQEDAGYGVLRLPDGRILIGGKSQDDILMAALLGDTNVLANSNNPPTLSWLPDLAIDNEPVSHDVELEGITAGGEIQQVRVSATSQNTALIPHPVVSYVDPNTQGLLTFSVTPDQVGSSMITVTVEDSGPDDDFDATDDNRSFSRTFTVTVTQFNNPPALDDIPDIELEKDSPEQTVFLTGITDGGTGTQPIRITAVSSHPSLIPDPEVTYTSGEVTGMLKFTPVPDQIGVSTVTVSIEDGGLDENLDTASDNQQSVHAFEITVVDVNAQPTLDEISSRVILEDSGEQLISLSGISAGVGESQWVRVTAITNNTELLSDLNVQYDQGSSTGTLSFTPLPDRNGTAALNVKVEDAGLDNDFDTTADNAFTIRAFGVEVTAVNDPPFFASLADLTIAESGPEQVVTLTGIHAGGNEVQELSITVTSSNHDLIAEPQITYVSGDSDGNLRFTPAAFSSGTATVLVTLEDSGPDGDLLSKTDNALFSRSFTVTVTPVNDPPTLGPLADIALDGGLSDYRIDLTNLTAGGFESQAIRVTSTSSDESVLPTPSVLYTSGEDTGQLSLNTLGVSTGESTVTVSVEDPGFDGDFMTVSDNAVFSRTFQVSVGGAGFRVEDGVLRLTIREPDTAISFVETDSGIEIHLADGVWFGEDATGVTGSDRQALLLHAENPFERIELRGPIVDALVFQDHGAWLPGPLGTSPEDNLRSVRNVAKDISIHIQWPALWQNPINRSDVNGDGIASTSDALALINQIARSVPRLDQIPLGESAPAWPSYFYDPTGDDVLSTLDALHVLYQLSIQAGDNGESESIDAVMMEWETNGQTVASPWVSGESSFWQTASRTNKISFDPVDRQGHALPSSDRIPAHDEAEQSGTPGIGEDILTLLTMGRD